MKHFDFSGVRKVILILAIAFCFAGVAKAQKPGTHYWGDSDGNGIIEIPDLSALLYVLNNPADADASIYSDHPQSRYRQELDGNGIIEVPDYSVLLGWVTGDFSNRPGNPDRLLLDGATLNVGTGDSVSLSAYGLSPFAQGSKVRTGLGVIFKIDPSGTCTAAQIYGYNTAGGDSINDWRNPAAYHYSSPPGSPDYGRATVQVRPAGCTCGQTIVVEVYIPADSESKAVAGRFPIKLSASQFVTINVTAACQQAAAIDVKPDNPAINEGDTRSFTATCTLADSSTVDCTNSYCGISTVWTVSGHLDQLVPANLVQARAGIGTGTVSADYYDGCYPLVSDASSVTVTDVTPSDTTSPTVILVNPADLATGVPVNTTVTATFSEAMDPDTISQLTFVLNQGVTPISGAVTYEGLIGTFTPSSPLAIDTTYTATVTTGARDLAGNALLSDYVWSFSTPKVLSPAPVGLGAAANFVILSGSGISSVPTSAITGDIGVSPATGAAITGLTCPEVTGTVYTVDGLGPACAVPYAAGLTAAKDALALAYYDAAGRLVPAPVMVSGDQGGLTLAAGIYKSASSLSIAAGNLTLDGQGDANAVWIFQIGSTLTTVGCGASVPCATGGNVMLINGAKAANVFWQVGSSATIGDYTAFEGTILAYVSISVGAGAQINGRLLSGAQPSGAGAVTLISDIVIIP